MMIISATVIQSRCMNLVQSAKSEVRLVIDADLPPIGYRSF